MPDTFDSAAPPSQTWIRSSRGVFVLLLGVTLAISWGARHRSWRELNANPETRFAQGVPASGSDSYYWFRIAREIREQGGNLGARDPLRAWPEGLERGPTPAYSWLIALTSRAFDGDVYRAGIALNAILSSLFIIPLCLYARGIGYPLAGLLGGYFGGLGHAYVQRSSVSRVDTDGGTLFFMTLLALGIGSLRATATLRRNVILAGLTGLSLAGFCRWYGQPWFWFAYLGTLALYLTFGGFARRQAAVLGLVFAICANPLSLLPGLAGLAHFLRFYVLPAEETVPNPFDYAHITRDISELHPVALWQTLAGVVDLPSVSALGLIGFAAFAVLRWRAALPLLPVALLGLFALRGPQRFGMFLAPLVGIGFGFALHALARTWRESSAPGRRLAEPVAYLGALALAATLLGHTGFASDPKPRVPVRTIAGLQQLASRLPPDPAVLASWGSGYLIADVTGAATFNDGEAPDPLVHYLFARAIASSDPRELVRIVSLLSTYGRSDLHAALDGRREPLAALDALLDREARTAGNVVLLLTERDVLPFPAFFRTGHWDFSLGEGPEDGYVTGDCERSGKQALRCTGSLGGEFGVDLANGRMSGGRWLRRVVETRDGVVVRATEHAQQAPLSLELVPRGRAGSYTAYFVSEPVFKSNFNQLYVLGRFDPSLLEEIYRAPPVMRAFRIRQQAAQAPSNRRARPRRRSGREGE